MTSVAVLEEEQPQRSLFSPQSTLHPFSSQRKKLGTLVSKLEDLEAPQWTEERENPVIWHGMEVLYQTDCSTHPHGDWQTPGALSSHAPGNLGGRPAPCSRERDRSGLDPRGGGCTIEQLRVDRFSVW